MKVRLQIFEGPLDLLLYLVKQNHLKIEQIPIAQITDQYLKYLQLMQALDLEIAGEFLVMAATLMQIKSRTLLPSEAVPPQEQEEPDPTQELIQRLQEYQRFKEAADALSQMEKERLVMFSRPACPDGSQAPEEELLETSLFDLLTAFSQFMQGQLSRELIHEIIQDEFTVEQKIAGLRERLRQQDRWSFTELFERASAKLEIIATFLALLELMRLKEVWVRQVGLFGPIVVLKNPGSVEVAG